ncbi:polyprenyl synthetase family protein, partial [Francisella tularensis subsp. holarctica]|uniref:polyprenyl synthetase family protein n=1 Tax=Francisella tularensis TaxID=263 RepID=UPI002381AE19
FYAICEALAIDKSICDKIAFSLEYIHTYSLIHDYLPAMDNDTLRRGKPTCQIKFNEATAILAGYALQAIAFEILQDIN